MCFLVLILRKLGFELFQLKSKAFTLLLQGFFDCNCDRDSHTDHGVVTSAQEAHHLNVLPGILVLLVKLVFIGRDAPAGNS